MNWRLLGMTRWILFSDEREYCTCFHLCIRKRGWSEKCIWLYVVLFSIYFFFSQKKRWTAAKPDYCKIPFVSILCAIEQVPWLVTCQCTNTAYRSTRAIIPIRSAIDNINGKKNKALWIGSMSTCSGTCALTKLHMWKIAIFSTHCSVYSFSNWTHITDCHM